MVHCFLLRFFKHSTNSETGSQERSHVVGSAAINSELDTQHGYRAVRLYSCPLCCHISKVMYNFIEDG